MSEDSKNKKIIGPALPPGFDRSAANEDEEEIVKLKKVYGPTRPPVDEPSQKSAPFRSRSRSPPADPNRSSRTNNRESWMTDIGSKSATPKLDPLNIKTRTFIQRRTESYEKDFDNEVIDPELKAKVKETDKQIKKYDEVHRQKTLQEIYEEEHMGKKKSQTESDRQERIFDWERDMNSTVRQMSTKSAKELVSKSTLNDRFGSSSTKKYL